MVLSFKELTMKILNITFLVIMGLSLAACATPPTEEMTKAQDVVTRAENDPDAVAYAPNLLVRARDALTRMQNEANAKRYDTARNYANEAINNAERAIADGKIAAARAKEEAANLISSLQTPLAEAASAIDTAQQNNLELDYDTLSGNLDLANQTYDDAQQSLETNNYPDAIAQGQSVRPILSVINDSLNDGVQASSRKK